MYIKNLQCEILREKGSDKPVVSFIASTANPDRYGDVINQRGWDLGKYRKNPVILLNHNANSLPIGRGEVDVVSIPRCRAGLVLRFSFETCVARGVFERQEDGFHFRVLHELAVVLGVADDDGVLRVVLVMPLPG